MRSFDRGVFGYRKSYKIRRGILIGGFLLAIIVQVATSRMVADLAWSRILLVMGILTVLPMANLLSPYIVAFRYIGLKKEQYAQVEEICPDALHLYDLVLTMREQVMALDVMFIYGRRIFAYQSNATDIKKTEKFLRENLSMQRIKVAVKVYPTYALFLAGVEVLEREKEVQDRQIQKEIASHIVALNI